MRGPRGSISDRRRSQALLFLGPTAVHDRLISVGHFVGLIKVFSKIDKYIICLTTSFASLHRAGVPLQRICDVLNMPTRVRERRGGGGAAERPAATPAATAPSSSWDALYEVLDRATQGGCHCQLPTLECFAIDRVEKRLRRTRP